MNQTLKSRFDKYINEGEKILWTGTPEKNSTNLGYIFFCSILSLFFLIFSLIWTSVVFANNAPTLFKIVGIVFITIGLFGTFIHIFSHKIRRSKIYYAISNKRIYIEYWFLGTNIKSYRITSLPAPKIRAKSNGLYTVLINYEKPFHYKLINFAPEYSWRDQYRRFEYIKDGNYVLKLILEQRKNLW